LGQIVAMQGGDLDQYLAARQSELAKLDEKNIILDTDPSVVSDAGLIQFRPQGTVDAFDDPVEEED
jgi:hypothetical protein